MLCNIVIMKGIIMECDLVIENVCSVFEGEFNVGFISRNKTRNNDGFVLYTKGQADYIFNGQTLCVKEGDVLYLPRNSSYNINIKQYSKYICIDFFFTASVVQRMGFVCRKVGTDIRSGFARAFHNWMRNDIYRLPKAYGILYDIYSSILYTTSQKYTKSSEVFSKAVEIILQNYSDENFSVESICSQLGLSSVHVRRIFREKAYSSPLKYLNYVRCEKAKNMLVSSNLSIKEIAESIGFYDPFYFSRMFKKNIGISPAEYRKKNA